MRRVILTDLLSEVLEDYQNALGDHFEVYTCDKADKLFAMIDHLQPDMLVLDLMLPGLDRKQVYDKLHGKGIFILLTATFCDYRLEQFVEQLGAKWFVTRPVQSSYIANRLLDFELEMDGTSDIALRSEIYNLLIQLRIPLSCNGFWVLTEGIVYACHHEQYSITEDLYAHVAKICGGTVSAVEMAMRRSIQQAFKHRSPIVWNYYVKNSPADKCPSNSVFIKQLAFMARKSLSYL